MRRTGHWPVRRIQVCCDLVILRSVAASLFGLATGSACSPLQEKS